MFELWKLFVVIMIGRWLVSTLGFARSVAKNKFERERIQHANSPKGRWHTW